MLTVFLGWFFSSVTTDAVHKCEENSVLNYCCVIVYTQDAFSRVVHISIFKLYDHNSHVFLLLFILGFECHTYAITVKRQFPFTTLTHCFCILIVITLHCLCFNYVITLLCQNILLLIIKARTMYELLLGGWSSSNQKINQFWWFLWSGPQRAAAPPIRARCSAPYQPPPSTAPPISRPPRCSSSVAPPPRFECKHPAGLKTSWAGGGQWRHLGSLHEYNRTTRADKLQKRVFTSPSRRERR